MTSYHVIKGGTKIDVLFQDGTVCPAKLLKQSPNIDIAILKIDRPTPDYLPMDSQPEIGVGDRVFTIGFPVEDLLGQEPKFTDGAISSLSGIKGEAPFYRSPFQFTQVIQGVPFFPKTGKSSGLLLPLLRFNHSSIRRGRYHKISTTQSVGVLLPPCYPPTVKKGQRGRFY